MMAYQAGYVVSILHNNHPVRESRGANGMRTCVLPFNAEYKIRVKNPTDTHAKVSISIDGTPVLAGNRVFLLEPGTHVDIERFVEDLTRGKRFKFVELGHGDVQDPTSRENGIIRVDIQPTRQIRHRDPALLQPDGGKWTKCGGNPLRGRTFDSETRERPVERCFPIGEVNSMLCEVQSYDPAPACACASAAPLSAVGTSVALNSTEVGATVEGSNSRQAFTMSEDRFEDFGNPVVIELQLRGLKEEQKPWRIDRTGTYYNGTRLDGVRATTQYDTGEVNLMLYPTAVHYDK